MNTQKGELDTLKLDQTRSLSQEQIQAYHQDGFVVIPNFFDLEEIKPLDDACQTDPSLKGSQTTVVWGDGTYFRIVFWTKLGDTMLGTLPRLARLVEGAERLLGKECYHYHSKILRKLPNEGNFHWHQDYSGWFEDGCLYPDLISCAIAIDHNTTENGCLQFAKKSHLLSRLDSVSYGDSTRNDPVIVSKILEQLEVVDCELEPGDAVFFHCKTLHTGGQNNTLQPRTLLYCTYNSISNEPWCLDGQEHHRYRPLVRVPDSALKDKAYTSVLFADDEIPAVETEASPSNFNIRLK